MTESNKEIKGNTEQFKKNIKIPPMKATGTLTVGDSEESIELVKASDTPIKTIPSEEIHYDKSVQDETSKKKEILKLPKKGVKFMIEGQEYKVTWLNPGQARFSAEPCKGIY